jgi:hypothetical protein
MKPGPEFAEVLMSVQTRQMEGTLNTREEALEWVKKAETHFDIEGGRANFKKASHLP